MRKRVMRMKRMIWTSRVRFVSFALFVLHRVFVIVFWLFQCISIYEIHTLSECIHTYKQTKTKQNKTFLSRLLILIRDSLSIQVQSAICKMQRKIFFS